MRVYTAQELGTQGGAVSKAFCFVEFLAGDDRTGIHLRPTGVWDTLCGITPGNGSYRTGGMWLEEAPPLEDVDCETCRERARAG